MVTLLRWTGPAVRGRCDGRCHGSRQEKCPCLCGGAFHGAVHKEGGLSKAILENWHRTLADAQNICHSKQWKLETAYPQKSLDGDVVLPPTAMFTRSEALILKREMAGPHSLAEVSEMTGLTSRGALIVLRHLAAKGVYEQVGEQWSLTELGRTMVQHGV